MNAQTRKISIPGPAGAIEVALDFPDLAESAQGQPRGLALVAHPHPLFGGTMDNKVVQTLARTFLQLGYVVARANFRGVGATEGVHDEGRGETDDLLAVLAHLQAERQGKQRNEQAYKEVVLGGFSFGSFVQTYVAKHLVEQGTPAARLVLVGTATSRWNVAPVPTDTLVIHGELDETVPLSAVLDWARPQDLPVVVIPGADHFFHRRLTIIKQLILQAWLGRAAWNVD